MGPEQLGGTKIKASSPGRGKRADGHFGRRAC